MATKQHAAFDRDPAAVSLRSTARRNDYSGSVSQTPVLVEGGQLRSRALQEAQSWKLQKKSRRLRQFEARWKSLKKSLESRSVALRNSSLSMDEDHEDVATFLSNSDRLRESLERTKDAVKKSAEYPQIALAASEFVPRVYAAASAYLKLMSFGFEEQSFAQYFNSIQEVAPFDTHELWQARVFVEFVLLERVALLAGRAGVEKQDSSSTSLERADAVPERMTTLINSLRQLSALDWKELFERINPAERVLRLDPSEFYAGMDFATREQYRSAVVQLAKRSEATEQEVAKKAIELARPLQASANSRVRERRSHVGYYLVGDGRRTLEKAIVYTPTWTERAQRCLQSWPDFSYILGIEVVTLALLALLILEGKLRFSGLVVVALFVLPASECAVALVNQFVTALFPPRALPKLDFTDGVPEEYKTVIAVPTLLTSEKQMARAVRDLEVRFLANRDVNLHFALLTDPPDAAQQFDDKDRLAGECTTLIEGLNAKYAPEGKGLFFLFHRHRVYNEQEGVWMAWERKRGKLLDFNKLLLGTGDNFPVKAGNLAALQGVKYVITLDADTQLPRDAARKLVGTIAHPLNRAVIDSATNIVVDGYGILQPRVDISIDSANRSRLAAIFSADAGFDIYTRAVSDVYQDLFGEGSFTGKGIYEISTFQQVLEHRFPCNTILSHDMIEGAYARAGLVSDIELVDDYPSHMSAFSRRKHRWVRGDWQILFWLLPRVPDFFNKIVPNPLSVISRWKILDNLRRSLTEIGTFAMLLVSWLLFPSKALYLTLATLLVVALPTFTQFAVTLLRARAALFTTMFWKGLGADFGVAVANLALRIACLCHQSLVAVDAVVRSIVRMTVTHERLLEWETAAEAEMSEAKKSPVETYLEITPWLSFCFGLLLAFVRQESFLVALPLLVLWALSKPICQWLNLPAQIEDTKMEAEDRTLLRQSALRTWRLFREFSTAEENWLVPDTVMEPASLIIHRISTTNLGLLMNSRLAALDMGFLTLPEFAADTERTFDAIDRMPRHEGQMYNWYDTQTLEAVKPRFVSTVDNGNLICALWTVKQGCLSAISQPIFGASTWQGVLDHLETIEGILQAEEHEGSLIAAVQGLKQRTQALGSSPEAWSDALQVLEEDVITLDKKLAGVDNSEASWWAHELCLRITHLEHLLYDFAPWLLPQYAKYRTTPVLKELVAPEKLTLQVLPELCANLDAKLSRLREEDRGNLETRSAVQLLRSAVTRTGNISKSVATRLARLAERADALAKSMDFRFFLDSKKNLLYTGYNVEEKRYTPSHYDLLASEARAAVFAAIAKGDIPQECWLSMERRFTKFQGERVLLSWTATIFEYLMPLLWMKPYANTILDETSQAAVRGQQKHAENHSIPWGISEASCSKINSAGHYHYEAFGVPGMAINTDVSSDLVVSPYSSFLSLLVNQEAALANIQRLKDLGLLGQYGFVESADFTPSRLKPAEKMTIVRCWLAHHQGMSLMAVANILCDASSQRRFHAEPMVAATERLLHEKAPRIAEFEPSGAVENDELAAAHDNLSTAQNEWKTAPKLNPAA